MTVAALTAEIAEKLAALYQEMEAGYDQVAIKVGLSCQGCPDNCCDSYFLHHTYIEWAYLWRGLATLAPPLVDAVVERARICLDHYRGAMEAAAWPKKMCPLNRDGLCILYLYRPMICRCHGVAARLRRPDGKTLHFPGCFHCQELTAPPGPAAEMDRTSLLRRLARLEEEFLGGRLGLLPKMKMTLADMLVAGPPKLA
ncbi:MAG: hypothetical protein LBH14_07115 [Desulfobulbaceae bacterium]|jgi:hypothetical protein|nr:hypothetical protein [Desulfobulbaceae bacterium]